MLSVERMLSYINRVAHLEPLLTLMEIDMGCQEMAIAKRNGLPVQYENIITVLDVLGYYMKIFALELEKCKTLQKNSQGI